MIKKYKIWCHDKTNEDILIKLTTMQKNRAIDAVTFHNKDFFLISLKLFTPNEFLVCGYASYISCCLKDTSNGSF